MPVQSLLLFRHTTQPTKVYAKTKQFVIFPSFPPKSTILLFVFFLLYADLRIQCL